MHERDAAFVGGCSRRQRSNQLVHGCDRFRLTRAVLLAPARDLPREIIAGLAVVAEAGRVHVEPCERDQCVDRIAVDGLARRRCEIGRRRIPLHATRHETHHIERAADDTVVFAQMQWCGDRHRTALQRGEHAELAIDRVRRREQLAGRLAPEHVAARRRVDAIGRVGLSTFKLRRRQRPWKPGTCAAR